MLPLRISACLAVLLPAASFAQDTVASATPAAVESSAFRLDFAPQVEYDGATLTVSGPNHFYLRQAFAAGDPIFVASEGDGVSLADGQYAWELTFEPRLSKATRQALARARDTGEEAQVSALRNSGALPSAPMIASGFFRVEQGAIVASDQAEAPGAGSRRLVREKQPGIVRVASADQVIPDDLIVQGSICVGFDCVNNESFGFDTIRLKENNTRIKFEDTSTGTFPSNDWQLTANDSNSGGANKFSIDDITGARVPFTVTAGAATNSIFVDSTGRVGFRTSTPVLDLHVATGNTPALRLEQNNTGGFSAQTWDVGGNEANFFVRDVTGGSRLSLRIRPGAPTSSIDIAASGNVGIGTASPEVDLHILRTSEAPTDVQFKIEANTDPAFDFEEQDSGVTWRFINNNAVLKVADVGTGADGAEEFVLNQAGNLTITGQLVTGGPQCGSGCDEVLTRDFELESIDEHADLMWSNSHLPAVGPTQAHEPFNVTEKMGGVLNELEKAHIYIEQLHHRLSQQEKANLELQRRLAKLETLLVKQDQ